MKVNQESTIRAALPGIRTHSIQQSSRIPSAEGAKAIPMRSPTLTSIRKEFELSVAWRVVEMVERAQSRHGALAAQSGLLSDELKPLLVDLSQFLQHGTSSLTGYEARKIAQGLGFAIRPDVHTAKIHAGDRVEFSFAKDGKSEFGRGLMLDESTILVSEEGRFFLRSFNEPACTLTRLISPALQDGR